MNTKLHNSYIGRHYYNGKLVAALIITTLTVVMIYMFLVIQTTINIADRKHLESEIRSSQTRIAQLEIDYFETANTIDMDRAKKLGLIESDKMHFAYSSAHSNVAVANTAE